MNDTSTWIQAAQILEQEDTKLGKIRVSLWHNLHLKGAPKQELSLFLVERLNPDGSKRVAKPLWLAWVGEAIPTLDEVWKLYLRRFAVDHWYRFVKQRLHWTLPKLATPKQCERWSELMPLMTWQLWLARAIVHDNPLPWQKSATKLTPGRVAQSIGGVLAVVETPAVAPKPYGKSPGWTTGQSRQRRIRYPIVKKGTQKSRKRTSQSA